MAIVIKSSACSVCSAFDAAFTKLLGPLFCYAVSKMDHGQYDCFLLALITHGDDGGTFYGSDGKAFTLEMLMAPIKRCRTLAGKPKICILQVITISQLLGSSFRFIVVN